MEFWADAQRHSSRAKAKNHSLSVWILLVPIDVEKTHTVERLATQTASNRQTDSDRLYIHWPFAVGAHLLVVLSTTNSTVWSPCPLRCVIFPDVFFGFCSTITSWCVYFSRSNEKLQLGFCMTIYLVLINLYLTHNLNKSCSPCREFFLLAKNSFFQDRQNHLFSSPC